MGHGLVLLHIVVVVTRALALASAAHVATSTKVRKVGVLLTAAAVLFLLVTLADSFPHWTARWALLILATTVMAKDIPAAHAMLHRALLIFAMRNVLPKFLHACTVGRDRALSCFVLASRSVTQQKQSLLLMPDLLPLRIIALRTTT